jgi:hypothetical protein
MHSVISEDDKAVQGYLQSCDGPKTENMYVLADMSQTQ